MEQLVIAALLADAPLLALVSTRVYPLARPQASALPAVTVTRVSGAPGYADDGETGLTIGVLQIDSWATTYTGAHTVADAVKLVLSALTSGNLRFVELDNQQDLREGGTNQYEYLFRVMQSYRIIMEG